jgi:hypothetical protein
LCRSGNPAQYGPALGGDLSGGQSLWGVTLRVSGLREFPIGGSAGFGLDQRPAVVAAARSLVLAFAIVLLGGDAALAVCAPTSPVNNATVTCTAATIDQNSAAG